MANHTTRTDEKDAKFLEGLAAGLPVGKACELAGYVRRTVYDWRREDEAFAQAWADADEAAVERMEAEADRRAVEGTRKPVFYQGQICGEIAEFSDTLLMFRLKGKRPDIYRERIEHGNIGGQPFKVVVTEF